MAAARAAATIAAASSSSRGARALVLAFPGQGSQAVGMAKDLAEAFPEARQTLEAVDEALQFRLSELMFEGPAEQLRETENAQPALLAHSLAVLRVLRERAPPELHAAAAAIGHSVGELSAWTAARVFSLAEASQLARRRGLCIRDAVRDARGSMVALFPCTELVAAEIASEAARETGETCVVANINSPAQVVLSGHARAVEVAATRARERFGVRRATQLQVSAAFHSPLMAGAVAPFRSALAAIEPRPPAFAVISNVDAQPAHSAADVRELLARHITAPVLWSKCVARALELARGGEPEREVLFLELGPGASLAALGKQILPAAPRVAWQSLAGAEQVRQYIG